MSISKRVVVIGAGASGLCSIKTCVESGLAVVCFEKSDTIGGLWVYRDEDVDGQPSVMKSTVINSSKEMSAFSDFPPPPHFPSFMHNRYMNEYLRSYAKHFGVEKHVKLKHQVLKVYPAEDYEVTGRWNLHVKNLDTGHDFTEVFDAVMLCAGHHVFPMIPDLPGLKSFKGKTMHTHSLKTARGMEEKEVLIVGNGNSGVDAAVEISYAARKVYLSTRRGFWLMNRYAPGGEPLDAVFNRRVFFCFPYSLGGFLLEAVANFRINHKSFNFRPKHSAIAQHPVLNDYLPARILSGTVQIKGAIDHFTEDGVVFLGEEKALPLDVVLLATGYSYKVPFVDQEYAQVNDEKCNLYKLVFPPNLPHPTLGFIGIIQPAGCIFPISEIQARWFVQLVLGKCKLPSKEVMLQEIKAREDFQSGFFIKAVRHLTEVIYITYMDSVAEEIGVKPDLFKLLFKDPSLSLYCFIGPCTPYQFRLQGPNAWSGARKAIMSYRKQTQSPLNTRKFIYSELGSSGRKVMNNTSFWALLLTPLFMYIMLFVL